MLFTIDNGNVPGCPHRQADIVHFTTTVAAVVASDLPYVFYDYNATLSYSTCYSDVKDLDKIDWDLFFERPLIDGYSKYWKNDVNNPKWIRRMETRQAEFLVHRSVSLKVMNMIGAYNEDKAAEVRTIFKEAGIALQVEPQPGWYF